MQTQWSETAEKRYRELIENEVREGCRMTAILALGLFPAFALLDYFTHRQEFHSLWIIRFSTTLFYLLAYLALRRGRLLARPFRTALVLLTAASVSITSMCVVLGGYGTPYYAGVNLVVLAAVLIFPWGWRRMAFAVGVVIGVYVAAVCVQARLSFTDPGLLINNIYFLLSTGIIGVAAAHLTDRLRRESFRRYLEIERAQELKSRFFANVSHELRTPLTLILGPVRGLMKNEPAGSPRLHELEVISRNAKILLKHVNDLLEVARLDAGEQSASYTKTDLMQLARRVASHFEILARERGIRFSVEGPDALPAEVDPEKLERVLMNLLSNAFKFTPQSGAIRCAIKGGREATIDVSDSGPGIPPELRSSVFERFYQVDDSAVRRFGGTGLGLAIVKDFVELHRGSVTVSESAEGGARFSIVLPIAAPAGAGVQERAAMTGVALTDFETEQLAREIRVQPAGPSESSLAPAGAALILVVEDNPDMNEFVSATLAKRYRVARARGGREGLERAKALRPDLIVSDVMMPEFSGVDLVREARRQPELDSTPIMLLTAKADDELRIDLLRSGAQDYLLKPFDPDELLARASNWVSLKRSRDILKDELATRQDDVETLAREITQSKRQVEHALRLRDDFISIASHELKTPLTSLQLQTQIAQHKMAAAPPPGASGSEYYSKLVKTYDSQLKRLNRLIEDTLDISRISSGKLELRPARTDLVALVTGALSQLHEKIETEKIDVTFRAPKSLMGNWDPFRLEQVVVNLLTNAIKYGIGKPIEISVSRRGDRALIEVRDQGIGIPPEKQTQIFERFERAAPSHQFSGLGLGLYIAREIVQAHGGEIRVESELGKGSTFTVELSAAPSEH